MVEEVDFFQFLYETKKELVKLSKLSKPIQLNKNV